eukprot:m.268194 g.268194  ORF g.268194 m.268194 type:complete len:212 (-) comp16052_c0_seq4:145-780(-)
MSLSEPTKDERHCCLQALWPHSGVHCYIAKSCHSIAPAAFLGQTRVTHVDWGRNGPDTANGEVPYHLRNAPLPFICRCGVDPDWTVASHKHTANAILWRSESDTAPRIAPAVLWAVVRRLNQYERDVVDLIASFLFPMIPGFTIGHKAFHKLYHLKFPPYWSYIGAHAFALSALRRAALPKYHSEVNRWTFHQSSLEEVNFDRETRSFPPH